uniref:Uncharacterized protein n=1 Tax=Stomoxys calcitrans TaxID=35570 RepID=A0A1I8PVJ8_STOCA
ISLLLLISLWCTIPSLAQVENFIFKLAPINTEEVQLEPIQENEYLLKIKLPDSHLEETLSLQPSATKSGDAVVVARGEVDTNFVKENVNLVVNYVADQNGYRASYRISKGVQPDLDISFGSRLNIMDLKSLAG